MRAADTDSEKSADAVIRARLLQRETGDTVELHRPSNGTFFVLIVNAPEPDDFTVEIRADFHVTTGLTAKGESVPSSDLKWFYSDPGRAEGLVGRFVALENQQLLGTGLTPKEARALAIERGAKRPLIFKVEPRDADVAMIGL